jgi:diguanylate cyclase (GGDEF)-like protein
VARAIEAQVRRSDTVARLGGDEFAVLVAGAEPVEAERVAASVVSAIESLWPTGLAGGASVGIASIEQGCGTVARLLSQADDEMYAVKRSRRLRHAS